MRAMLHTNSVSSWLPIQKCRDSGGCGGSTLNPSLSETYDETEDNSEKVLDLYGGELKGKFAVDQVATSTRQTWKIPELVFVAVEENERTGMESDCVLGLAPVKFVDNPANLPTSFDDLNAEQRDKASKSFVASMFLNQQIPYPNFTLILNEDGESDAIFGSYDESRDITFFAVREEEEAWILEFDQEISIGENLLQLEAESIVFDSSLLYSYLPEKDYDYFMELFKEQNNCIPADSRLLCSCEKEISE